MGFIPNTYPCKHRPCPYATGDDHPINLPLKAPRTPPGAEPLDPLRTTCTSGLFICISGPLRPCAYDEFRQLDEYLRAIYDGVGHVYAPFMSHRLHYHYKLMAQCNGPVTVARERFVCTTCS